MKANRLLPLLTTILVATVLVSALTRLAQQTAFAATPAGDVCVPAAYTAPLTSSLTLEDSFGPRLLGSQGRYDFHRGIDWDVTTGDPVYAVTTGTVTAVVTGSTGAAGNYVRIYHRAIDCETRYAHLDSVDSAIVLGAPVNMGDQIGRAGSSGASHAHLHFEVWQGENGTARNAIHPLRTPFIPDPATTAPTVTMLAAFRDGSGVTLLFTTTTPISEPTITTLVGTVGTLEREIDFEELNHSTLNMAALDTPYVNNTCMIAFNPSDTEWTTVYGMRQLQPTSTSVGVDASTVDGHVGSAAETLTMGRLEMLPHSQTASAVPSSTVTLTYRIANNDTTTQTVTFEHLSAHGWPSEISPASADLSPGSKTLVELVISLDNSDFGPADCGFLLARSSTGGEPTIAGFYELYRDAYVSPSGSDLNEGSSGNPFATIQHAINRTVNGGTIHVEAGEYIENVVLTRSIDLLGGYDASYGSRTFAEHNTTINGNLAGTTFEIEGDYNPLVEGFTFYKGSSSGHGGGVRIVGEAAPTLRNSWVVDNTAYSGGGIFVAQNGTIAPRLINLTVAENNATSKHGGGIYLNRSAQIIGTDILSNSAANEGGGVYISGTVSVAFTNNRVVGNISADDGGGMVVRSGANVIILGDLNSVGCDSSTLAADHYCSEFRENHAGYRGGAIYTYDAGGAGNSVQIEQSALISNSADDAGTLYAFGSNESITLTNDLLVGNMTTHTIYMRGGSNHLDIFQTTIADNVGAALHFHSSTPSAVQLYNSLIWGNGSGLGTGYGSVSKGCNIDQDGTHGRLRNPRFIMTAGSRYQLRPASPAIDACRFGSAEDIEGQSRPYDYGGFSPVRRYDIGAFEMR